MSSSTWAEGGRVLQGDNIKKVVGLRILTCDELFYMGRRRESITRR
jgi:hypothetical protein